MFIDKDSIIINGVSMGQYLSQAEYQYPKLWGDDTGRSLIGDFTGTLQGIFPKIRLSFKKLTQQQLETIAPILDSATQAFSYYDPNKKQTITIETYSGDWAVTNKGELGRGRKNESFEISFISRRKRI